VYKLHPLIPTKHVLLTFSGDQKDANPIKIFINTLTNLENYKLTNYKHKKLLGIGSGNRVKAW
jgi:hypothetical protein